MIDLHGVDPSQVASLMKNEQQSQSVVLKLDPRSTFDNNFIQLTTKIFVARQVDQAGWKSETSIQNLQQNNVARQVEGFCILYFATLRH